jgi:hypothetical protein
MKRSLRWSWACLVAVSLGAAPVAGAAAKRPEDRPGWGAEWLSAAARWASSLFWSPAAGTASTAEPAAPAQPVAEQPQGSQEEADHGPATDPDG